MILHLIYIFCVFSLNLGENELNIKIHKSFIRLRKLHLFKLFHEKKIWP